MSKRSTQRSQLAYAHHSHRGFNERLASGSNRHPHDIANAHWMKPDTLARLPKAKTSFGESRDPLIAKQRADLGKTEAQRRESLMIKRQKPKQILRPPLSLSLGPDRAAFHAQLRDDDKRARFIERRKTVPDIAHSRSRKNR